MKAVIRNRYGTPEVLTFADVDKPVPKDDEVLVRVRAAALNPYDWHMLRGAPYLVRLQTGLRTPKSTIPGVDLAGQVEAVGRDVTGFQPGDEVFGMRSGSCAEYVCVRADRMVLPKPANLTFEEAAAVPLAALSALQGLRDRGNIQPGQKVLVNGASGGIGTFAVQIAKAYGAEVTGVCRTRNVEMVRAIGADHVVDYTRADFADGRQRYDLILDTAGGRTLSEFKRALTPRGTYVSVGGPLDGLWIWPLLAVAKVTLAGWFGSRRMVSMLTKNSREDLLAIRDLLESGQVTPVVDRRYPLTEVPDALGYVGQGHTRGKVVITV